MPEGPEIRLMADKLIDVVLSQPLTRVWFARSDLHKYSNRLQSGRIIDIKTKGKALLTGFDCGLTIYSHNQLYGRWYFMDSGTLPRTNRQLRLAIETPNRSALLYSASEIEVLDTGSVHEHPFVARAGIDILSDKPGLNDLSSYLKQKKFARRALGGLLLDQGFIAGSGNYLRSEILFTAGLHHNTRLVDINGHQHRKLARQIIKMIEHAYQTAGITNEEKTVKQLKAKGWPRSCYRHFVFARAGQPCHRCGAIIQKMQVASRRLYWCPSCQPA